VNHKHLLAGVAAAAIMAAGNAYAGAHASVEDQVKANAAAIDALSKEVEALKAGNAGPAKGVKGVSLKISGHINRAVAVFSDANDNTDVTYVDNDASSTRVRWDASASMGNGMKVGSRLEMEMESNSSVAATGQLANNNAGGDAFAARHAYVYIQGGFGTLTTGQQGEATEGILHSSFNFASLADINPEHTNGSSIAGGGFLAFGDGGRQDSIRYDTPNFGGAKASISARDNGEVTAAIRYSGKVAGVGVLAGLGYEENFGNNIIAGSMGINLGVVAVNGAMGWTLNEGANVEDDFYYYIGLAHKGNYTDMGATSIAIDFDNNNGGRAANQNNASIGVGLVQGVAPGADAYASFRTFFGAEGGVDSAQAVLIGMRVRF
jgi:hypothetical protein